MTKTFHTGTAPFFSMYDIEDAKNDEATVPIYYESRLAKLDINRAESDTLNKDVEEVMEDEEDLSTRENTKGKYAQLAKLVGADDRLDEAAADLADADRDPGGPQCAVTTIGSFSP